MIWKCPVCLQDISLDFNELPFASLSEESFNSTVRMDPPYNKSSQTDSNSDQLLEIAREIKSKCQLKSQIIKKVADTVKNRFGSCFACG